MGFSFKKEKDAVGLFEELIHPVYHDLYKYIYTIVRNQYAADDILQSTLLNGYKSLYQLKDRNSFKSWMMTIAKRESLRFIQKTRRELLIDPESVKTAMDHEHLCEIYNGQDNLELLLGDIINGLKEEYQEVIVLIYYTDLSLEEVALVLNTNYNTVKTWHRRAKKAIQEELIKLSESTG